MPSTSTVVEILPLEGFGVDEDVLVVEESDGLVDDVDDDGCLKSAGAGFDVDVTSLDDGFTEDDVLDGAGVVDDEDSPPETKV